MSDVILVETTDRVCVITLHRPQVRNALNTALSRASASALAAAEADVEIDVVVLTGSDPAFCAGLDLKELGAGGTNLADGSGDPDNAAGWANPVEAVWKMTKPVIGAINGACVTGGLELALGCDFLIASERAFFGDTHVRVGVMPGGAMSVFLPMAVGLRRAKEMSLTGKFVDAHEAHRLGLVNHVVAHDELLGAVRALAAGIAANEATAVRGVKQLFDESAQLPVGEAVAHARAVFRDLPVDPDEIEQRRRGVVERGRAQH
ncbi:MAG: enoyl-CoA hydratase [Acidimicrobiia bacterium]|nr:enoyl-CoA hydratase [Acidimicrobiia bacterium]